MDEKLTNEQVDALVRDEDPRELYNGDRDCISDWVTRALALEVQQARQRIAELEGALIAVRPVVRTGLCWCPLERRTDLIGHNEQCMRAQKLVEHHRPR